MANVLLGFVFFCIMKPYFSHLDKILMHGGFPVLQLIVQYYLVWSDISWGWTRSVQKHHSPTTEKGHKCNKTFSPYLLLNLPFCVFLPANQYGIIWSFSFVCVNILFIGAAEAMCLLIISAAAFSHSLEEENCLGVPCQIYLLRLGAGRFDRVCFSESLISAVTLIFIRI